MRVRAFVDDQLVLDDDLWRLITAVMRVPVTRIEFLPHYARPNEWRPVTKPKGIDDAEPEPAERHIET